MGIVKGLKSVPSVDIQTLIGLYAVSFFLLLFFHFSYLDFTMF